LSHTTELDVLKDVIGKLESASFEYMLTGSMAMNYYAEPRMTRDIDIVIALTPEDGGKINSLFSKDYYISEDAVTSALRDTTMFNLLHLDPVVKVDMIILKANAYRLLEFERRRQVKIANLATWIVSKEDLILSKLYWAEDSQSDFQYRDVKNLLATGADHNYLTKWAPTLGVALSLEQCLNE